MKSIVSIKGHRVQKLAKGENPYQVPASFFSTHTPDPLSLPRFKQISGNPPSFTNLCGVDRLIQTLTLCHQAFILRYHRSPFIVVAAKHGNPCGLGVDWNQPLTATRKALFGNPLAIWGGEVITNFSLDEKLALAFLTSTKRKKILGNSNWMLDIILAPKFNPKAQEILGKRPNRKLLVNPSLTNPTLNPSNWTYRFVRGGFLRQPPANYVLDFNHVDTVSGHKLTPSHYDSLIIAWATTFSSMHGGNEIALAKNRALLSCGGGPSTVEATQLALIKAKNQKHTTENSLFSADAFFPFTDAPVLLAKAGVIAGTVPSGSIALPQIKDFFRQHQITTFFIPENYRGFCYH